MLGRISRPFLSTRSVVRPLNQARFFHRPSPYRVLNPKPFYLTEVPRIKVFAIDGAGSSGDENNERVAEALMESVIDHYKEQGCAINEKLLRPMQSYGVSEETIYNPIIQGLGLGKKQHLQLIVSWLIQKDFNIRTRYNVDLGLVEYDVDEIHKRFQTQGAKIIAKSSPVRGFTDVVKFLKNENIEIVLQTAYGDKEAHAFKQGMEAGGVTFKECVTSSHVKHPRPFQSMLDRIKDIYGVHPWEVLVGGDTVADMKAARGYWRVGFPGTSSLFKKFTTLTLGEETREIKRVGKILEDAGAQYNLTKPYHEVPMHVQLKSVISCINERMSLNDFGDNKTVELIPELRSHVPTLCRK